MTAVGRGFIVIGGDVGDRETVGLRLGGADGLRTMIAERIMMKTRDEDCQSRGRFSSYGLQRPNDHFAKIEPIDRAPHTDEASTRMGVTPVSSNRT